MPAYINLQANITRLTDREEQKRLIRAVGFRWNDASYRYEREVQDTELDEVITACKMRHITFGIEGVHADNLVFMALGGYNAMEKAKDAGCHFKSDTKEWLKISHSAFFTMEDIAFTGAGCRYNHVAQTDYVPLTQQPKKAR